MDCFCSVEAGFRWLWETDAYLQAAVPALSGKGNKLFDDGLGTDPTRDGRDYVIIRQGGDAVPIAQTSHGTWYQVSHIFDIYSKNKGRAGGVKDHLVRTWVPDICDFCVADDGTGKYEVPNVTAKANPIRLADGWFKASVTVTGREYVQPLFEDGDGPDSPEEPEEP